MNNFDYLYSCDFMRNEIDPTISKELLSFLKKLLLHRDQITKKSKMGLWYHYSNMQPFRTSSGVCCNVHLALGKISLQLMKQAAEILYKKGLIDNLEYPVKGGKIQYHNSVEHGMYHDEYGDNRWNYIKMLIVELENMENW